MNWMEYLQAIIMGAVEGITEFLPVSSTGHLIITADLIDFHGELASNFEIVIQLAAILAVCWLYRHKLFEVVRGLPGDARSWRFVENLAVAFIPAAAIGFVFHDRIKQWLFNPVTVAIALIVGGFVILLVERFHFREHVKTVDDLQPRDALKVGCVQVLALIPGTSRSGATIIGGLLFGLSRQAATEFSFFLAIPIMFAATAFDLAKNLSRLNSDYIAVLAIGFVTAFITAVVAVRGFVRFVSKHNFTAFAIYRIAFGAIVLWYYLR